MLKQRDRYARGATHLGWLNSLHSFSFGHYYDPKYLGFNTLRVINEDRVAPGAGFDTHPHNNMEIISYVLTGQLAHQDSMGNGSIIKPGDIQLMSAGSGIAHSEYNASKDEEVHFLQIWITPNVYNQQPCYQQKSFNPNELQNTFRVVVSPDSENGSLLIKQDARMLLGQLTAGNKTTLNINQHRNYWIQVAQGTCFINEMKLSAGDGISIEQETLIHCLAVTDTELLLFDLP